MAEKDLRNTLIQISYFAEEETEGQKAQATCKLCQCKLSHTQAPSLSAQLVVSVQPPIPKVNSFSL